MIIHRLRCIYSIMQTGLSCHFLLMFALCNMPHNVSRITHLYIQSRWCVNTERYSLLITHDIIWQHPTSRICRNLIKTSNIKNIKYQNLHLQSSKINKAKNNYKIVFYIFQQNSTANYNYLFCRIWMSLSMIMGIIR